MSRRLLVIFALFSPLAAQANCSSFDASTQTLEIRTRAANADRVECDASGYALKDDGPANAAPTPPDRRSSTDKLRAFKDLKRQAEYLDNPSRYYGQR